MTDDLRQRGIEYLLSKRQEEKQPHELAARELSTILKMNESSVYKYMSNLVEEGTWKTREAYDPSLHKTIRVWWLIE